VESVFDTGIDNEGERSYLFTANFAGVALNAGTSYWFSVTNTRTPNTFRWTESTSGLDTAVDLGAGWIPLTDAEPSSMFLLGIGGLGLIVKLRSRRKRTQAQA
jgi:hypothetical protein